MIQNEIRFGRNLNILRSIKGIPQKVLADAIHVTRQTISTWERGKGKPDIYYIHDICNYFDVSIEKILYGNILNNEEVSPVFEEDYDFSNYIKKLNKCGYYTILDEDLDEFFGFIKYDLQHISVTALVLSKRGYIITEVFDNGFSIYLKSDEELIRFQSDLYDVLDSFIHHDNTYVEENLKKAEEIINTASSKVLEITMEEILGANIDSFKYYWVDEMENPRGYANSKEDCKLQAELQKCINYTILPMV